MSYFTNLNTPFDAIFHAEHDGIIRFTTFYFYEKLFTFNYTDSKNNNLNIYSPFIKHTYYIIQYTTIQSNNTLNSSNYNCTTLLQHSIPFSHNIHNSEPPIFFQNSAHNINKNLFFFSTI